MEEFELDGKVYLSKRIIDEREKYQYGKLELGFFMGPSIGYCGLSDDVESTTLAFNQIVNRVSDDFDIELCDGEY